jgi:NADH pyrophosphatase NudC (nudix superfamily)
MEINSIIVKIMSYNKIKECKVNILKRMKALEDKYKPGYVSTFSYHESKLTASNIAIWKMAQRGVITPEEVRTAIYQLEKSGLLEIIDRTNIKLTDTGRQTAEKIRSMTIEMVPDELLKGTELSQEQQKKSGLECPECHKLNKEGSKFCAFCGAPLEKKKSGTNCPYCGEKINPNAKFCSNCGASLD